jgi:hypothetical protein
MAERLRVRRLLRHCREWRTLATSNNKELRRLACSRPPDHQVRRRPSVQIRDHQRARPYWCKPAQRQWRRTPRCSHCGDARLHNRVSMLRRRHRLVQARALGIELNQVDMVTMAAVLPSQTPVSARSA